MEFVKQNKNIFIAVGVLLLLFVGYFIWRSGGQEESFPLSNLDASAGFTDSPGGQAGRQIISILNELQQIRIDRGVFDHVVFNDLIDHTIATTSEDRGRPDPFEPLPFEFKKEEPKRQ